MHSNSVPYTLPRKPKSQLQFLAKVTSIPRNLLTNAGTPEIEALSAMILYRHLNRQQRIEAMTMIRAVQNKALMGTLISKTLDTTFVNPQWGVWSLNTQELQSDIEFHSSIDSVAGYVGVGASALGGKDFIKNIWSQKRMGKQHWIMLVIWGCVYINKKELKKAQTELNNRTTINTSRHY
jgi:hypothetical protein